MIQHKSSLFFFTFLVIKQQNYKKSHKKFKVMHNSAIAGGFSTTSQARQSNINNINMNVNLHIFPEMENTRV